MAATDDYKPLTPVWAVVLRVLDQAAQPLILTELQDKVLLLLQGRGARSIGGFDFVVRKLVADGLVDRVMVRRGPTRHVPGFLANAEGRDFLADALGVAGDVLGR